MKIRQKLLLENLLKEKTLSLLNLEKEFDVSKKTLQNDFQELIDYLQMKGFSKVIEVKRGKVNFLGDEFLYEKISKEIEIHDFYIYRLSTSERVLMILAYLFLETNYITISYLCDRLYVSRSTINSDLIFVKEWCSKNKINLILKTKNGIKIEETNKIKRYYLVEILKMLSNLNKNNQSFYQNNEFYAQLFQGIDLTIIRAAIVNAEKRFHFNFSDEIYHELVIQIASLLFMPFEDKEVIKIDLDYKIEKKMAMQIIKDIKKELPIVSTKKLEQKIALYIKSATFHLQINKEQNQLPYIQLISQQLIKTVSNNANINFKWNKSLFTALIQHISGFFFRNKYNIVIQNPLKDKLIKEEPELYEAINLSKDILRNVIGKEISIDEISYLLIYFASAKNEALNTVKSSIPQILILCSTGQGTAQIVKNNLKKYFLFNIKGLIAEHQLNSINTENIDFIISTIPLISKVPHIQVNPMLRLKDIYAIYQLMFSLGFSPPINNIYLNQENQSDLAKQTSNLLIQYQKKEDEGILLEKLKKLISIYSDNKQNKGDIQYMLSELLTKDNIRLNVVAKDWKEAVIASGSILENNDIVEHRYVEAAIKNVMDLGPYIVVTKGVAIPHANSNLGVNKTAISLARLKTPVCFGNPDNDPVNYVFTLATVNSTSHLKALQDLVSLLDSEQFYDVIDKAISPDEIIKYIKNFEKTKGED